MLIYSLIFDSSAWQPTPVFLPGESHEQRSLVGYCPWGHNESDMTERMFQLIHRFLILLMVNVAALL